VREKGGNGARYGEMARKPGIVTGNGRRSSLTERKLESEEIVGGQPLPAWSLHKPYHSGTWKEDKGGNELRYLTNENRWRDQGRPYEGDYVNAKKKIVGLSFWLVPFFTFLSLSSLLELRAETVRGIKLTSPTCWRPPEFLSQRPVKTFCF